MFAASGIVGASLNLNAAYIIKRHKRKRGYVYDSAKASDWSSAESDFNKLKATQSKIGTEVTGQQSINNKLKSNIKALGEAINKKDQHTALLNANNIILTSADMTDQYEHKVPYAVAQLDY